MKLLFWTHWKDHDLEDESYLESVDWNKSCALLVETQISLGITENNIEIPERLEKQYLYDPSISLLVTYPNKTNTDQVEIKEISICTLPVLAKWFKMTEIQKPCKCLSVSRDENKM